MKSYSLTLFFGYAIGAFAQQSTDPKVLTVCEALRDIDMYRGKMVVIVGRSNYTFEGNFLHEKCEPDERILIQGNRWLSAIAWAQETPTETAEAFPIEEEKLRKKLNLPDGRHDETQPAPERILGIRSGSYFIAVYGRLESPDKLRPPGRRRAGNGYGANGSVPAMIPVVAYKSFPDAVPIER